jgi:2-polyprenyl-6-methoxyphenol hydroxylase-like FAD-dependent oxidoreductase
MLIDGQTIREPEALTADLCVEGAGAAGLALALELAESPIRVLVLEQGGATQASGGEGLYRIVGQPRPRLTRDRNRAWFGGGVPRIVQTCPEPRLAVLHRQRLHEATNVQIVTGARVTQLETDARADAVTSVHGTLADGRRFLRDRYA